MRRRLRALFIVLLFAFALLEAAYLVAANYILNSDRVFTWVNPRPERVLTTWSHGWSIFPGSVHINKPRVKGTGKKADWYVELDDVHARVRLRPLFERRVVLHAVRASALDFRLRRKPTEEKPLINEEVYPDIPAFTAPARDPARPRRQPTSHPWSLHFPDVVIDDIRQLWINRVRLSGEGRVTADLDLVIRGPLHIRRSTLVMPAAVVDFDTQPILESLTLDVEAGLAPFVPKGMKGRLVLDLLDADIGAHGNLLKVGFLDSRVGGDSSGFDFEGSGTFDADLLIEKGKYLPGSKTRMVSDSFKVRFLDFTVLGSATIQETVRDEDGTPVSEMTIELPVLELDRDGHEDAPVSGRNLRLRSLVRDPALADIFPAAETTFEIPEIIVEDITIFNEDLPAYPSTELLTGSATARMYFSLDPDDRAEGELELRGEAISFRALEETFQGDLGLQVRFRSENILGDRFNLAGTNFRVDRILVPGLKESKGNGWWSEIRVDNGAIDMATGGVIDASIAVDMRDTRPVMALLNPPGESKGWRRMVPTIKEVSGEVDVALGPGVTDLRRVEVDGKHTRVRAKMRIDDDGPDGLVYVKWGMFHAAVKFADGERHWKIARPWRWYEEELAKIEQEKAD